MFIGPLRWPSARAWTFAALLTVATCIAIFLSELLPGFGTVATVLVVGLAVALLIFAARERSKELDEHGGAAFKTEWAAGLTVGASAGNLSSGP